MKRAPKTNPGPEPETLSIPGPWEDAVNRALRTKKPAKGFPKRAATKRKRPAKRASTKSR